MQTVSVGEQKLLIKPARLVDLISKVDYMKSRRPGVWDLLKQLPRNLKADTYESFVRVAMSVVHTNGTSVGVDEELAFDNSLEGFYWMLWQCMESRPKAKKKTFFDSGKDAVDDPLAIERAGIASARSLWESATDDEKKQLRLAMMGVNPLPKNSDGPPSSETTGPESQNQPA